MVEFGYMKQLDANRPTVIDIVDGRLSNGRSHSMSLTLWTVPDMTVAEQKRAARVLAIGFLERTLAALRAQDLN